MPYDDEGDLIEAYEEYRKKQKAAGKTPPDPFTNGRGMGLLVAVNELDKSANPPPPTYFATGDDFKKFLDTKELRGWTTYKPTVVCKNGTISSVKHEDWGGAGWTPIRNLRYDEEGSVVLKYARGEEVNSTITESGGPGGQSLIRRIKRGFVIGGFGAAIAKFLTGAWPPLAWHVIEYEVSCPGGANPNLPMYKIKLGGSYFPTHAWYLEQLPPKTKLWLYRAPSARMMDQANEALPGFIYAGANNFVPGEDVRVTVEEQ